MNIPQKIKTAVILRDGHACRYCGHILVIPRAMLTFDHLVPVSRGGETTIDNLVVACKYCNSSKGDRTAAEWGRILFPARFFEIAVEKAITYVNSLTTVVELVDCLQCGEKFNMYSDYNNVPRAARRRFCKQSHAMIYSIDKIQESEKTNA